MTDLINILLLSTFAGLATGIGGLIVLIKRPGQKLFGYLSGLAAGVMVVLSFMGLMDQAWKSTGFLTATLGFAAGALLMFLLDIFIPHVRFETREGGIIDPRLYKTGVLVAIGISLHNIPEGMAVGAGYLHLPQFGILIAISIALHNIPEGMATALPLYMSGASRVTAFTVALFSGMVEPLGAMAAALFLASFQFLVPVTLAFAAGVMLFITLDELIPTAHKNGHEHYISMGIISGAILMFLLLGMFQ